MLFIQLEVEKCELRDKVSNQTAAKPADSALR